ncbi:acetoacetate--CoA ligase [Williamsia sp. M5A3_1d]
MNTAPETTAIERFAHCLPDGVGRDYASMWQWSIDEPARFWRALWDFFDLENRGAPLGPGDDAVLPDPTMPGARWFPGVELNYVDQILRHAHEGHGPALIGIDEAGERTVIDRADLPGQIGALAAALADAGVGKGDVVVGYLPDIVEAMTVFLATASLGAIWSGCGADYAPDGAAARLGQLAPTALVVANGYRYNGKWIDKRAHVAELVTALPTLRAVVTVHIDGGPVLSTDGWDALAVIDHGAVVTEPRTPQVTDVAFDHPLWVLFSSGTTGRPKGIVHGHGGVVLEHLKVISLHSDLGPRDVFFWQTALSWMMWNYRVAGLLCGATVICYSGSPLYPDADRLWSLLEREGVTYFGTSPGQLQASRKAGLHPGTDHDLRRLATLGSTGSTLAADLFDWVAENVGADVAVSSVSGGTDVVTAFVGGSVGEPVVPGELSVRYLGVALHSWAPDRTELIDEVGEMVITTPMPSMPVSFWADDDGSRYRAAYFEHVWTTGEAPGVWRHGDWVTVTDRGSVVIHGRSDATLNRHGIRMGSADIYEVVEAVPEIAEAFVLGVDGPAGAYWMPLFVTLVDGATLDDDLISRIASDVRTRLSPRHVPDEVIEAPGIPHTRTGKKLEVPVTGILAGRSDVAIDPRSMDDPSLLEWYTARGAAHRW